MASPRRLDRGHDRRRDPHGIVTDERLYFLFIHTKPFGEISRFHDTLSQYTSPIIHVSILSSTKRSSGVYGVTGKNLLVSASDADHSVGLA